MKNEIKNTLILVAFLLCLLPALVWAADYTVSTGTSIVDGNNFCGGSKCSSSDTIIIAGGARGGLKFQNFDGNGSYITIKNDNSTRVVITRDDKGSLTLDACKYVDLRGDSLAGEKYGIKVINDGDPRSASTVRIKGKSGHIKISYLEIAFDGNTTDTGNGIFIADGSLSSSWIWDTVEIHHNYIHNARYAGMYLGQNKPDKNDDPYLANVSVHDNILENLGSYGITLKGVSASSGPCSIYNNKVTTTGLVYEKPSGQQGIGVIDYYGSAYANIYNNRIEASKGAGLKIGDGPHNVYNNILVNCGTGNDSSYGHGIVVYAQADGNNIYNNIIIQPTRYGIYGLSGAVNDGITASKNLIGDPGLGYVYSNGKITEGTGADANVYHANVADFNFPAWSDDGNYSNDIFITNKIFSWPGKDDALSITKVINN